MSPNDKVTVEYKNTAKEVHEILFNSEGVPDITIDYTDIPTDRRGGTSVALLAASALYCFSSTLYSCLIARGAEVLSLTGRATAEKEKDEVYRTKVAGINIEVEVGLEDKDLPILEK